MLFSKNVTMVRNYLYPANMKCKYIGKKALFLWVSLSITYFFLHFFLRCE